ncbi:Uncharacterized protein SCF082_LOCUS46990, partial [Durusdinium trenchii]
ADAVCDQLEESGPPERPPAELQLEDGDEDADGRFDSQDDVGEMVPADTARSSAPSSLRAAAMQLELRQQPLSPSQPLRDELALEDGFDFNRDFEDHQEPSKPSKATTRSFSTLTAQPGGPPVSPTSPNRMEINPGILSMQKPQPDLWSRTHGRAPTTTSLRSMAQRAQSSRPGPGSIPTSPSSPQKAKSNRSMPR